MADKAYFAIPGDLASPTGGYGYDRRLLTELPRQGWEVEHVALPSGFPFPSGSSLAETARRLGRLPDEAIVLVDGLAFGAMPLLAAGLSKRLRLIALVHHPLADETGLAEAEADRLRGSERAALGHARQIICTSDTTAGRLIAGFGVDPARLAVARPGTDRARRAPGGQGASPLVVCVGTVTQRKGHDVLIEALGRLRAMPWRCRVVGALDRNPQWVASVNRLAADLDIADRVDFVGAVADIGRELHGADLFALATRHEGYGMAFAEALAHGLPIVACDAGAVSEVVPARAGHLVPVDDVAAFAEALTDLLGDRDRRQRAADAAWDAGQSLPDWQSTARIVAERLREASL